jgi:hypothetical protein
MCSIESCTYNSDLGQSHTYIRVHICVACPIPLFLTHTHAHAHTHTNTNTNTNTHVHVHTHTNTHTHITQVCNACKDISLLNQSCFHTSRSWDTQHTTDYKHTHTYTHHTGVQCLQRNLLFSIQVVFTHQGAGTRNIRPVQSRISAQTDEKEEAMIVWACICVYAFFYNYIYIYIYIFMLLRKLFLDYGNQQMAALLISMLTIKVFID